MFYIPYKMSNHINEIMNTQLKIKCPTCGEKDTWRPENEFRPFCSSRCKLIDLGEWANESRKIPGDPVDPTSLSDEDLDANDHF
jgi:uncharacterized protein